MSHMEGLGADLAAVDTRELGARVRAARLARGWTQSELAGGGMSTGYVSRIESGSRRPTLKVVAELARRLDTTVEQLVRGVDRDEYERLRLTLDYAEIALESGEAEEALGQAREGLQAAEQAHLSSLEVRARWLLGRALEATGALAEAIDAFERLVERADGLLRVQAGIALSRCYRDSGDLTLAIEAGERVAATLAGSGLDHTDEAVQLAVTVAAAYAERGDLNEATRRCAAAIAKADELSSPQARAAAYWNASVVEASRGRTTLAAPLAARALALLSEGRDQRNLARLRAQLGRLLLQSDPPQVESAREHVLRAHQELEQSSASTLDLAFCDVTLAQAHLLAGDAEQATALARRALEGAPANAYLFRAEAMIVLGQVAVAEGGIEAARESYRSAVHLLTAVGADRSAAQVWYELAELLEDVGELDAARSAFRSAAAATGLSGRRARVAQVRESVPAHS